MPDADVIARFRAMLDRMVEARSYPNEYREEAHDAAVAEIAQMSREPGLLVALDKAVGRSKRRKQESVYLLSCLADLEGASERIATWLQEGDAEARSWIIQTIGHKGLTQFAEHLNQVLRNDPDQNCREFAVRAAGHLRCEVNLPVLLELTEEEPRGKYSRLPWALLWALKDYSREEARPFFERYFQEGKDEDRIMAAWGLCKLGSHPEAHDYLVGFLADRYRSRQTGYFPVESLRAAQALCDVHEWASEWGQEAVKTAREKLGIDKPKA